VGNVDANVEVHIEYFKSDARIVATITTDKTLPLTSSISIPFFKIGARADKAYFVDQTCTVDFTAILDQAKPLNPATKTTADERQWMFTTKLEPQQTITITICDLNPIFNKDGAGNASIYIGIKSGADVVQTKKEYSFGLEPKKEYMPAIYSFDATPDFVLHAGSDPVTLQWHAIDAGIYLYKNNARINLSDSQTVVDGRLTTGQFTDSPLFTSVYRLEARPVPGNGPETAGHPKSVSKVVQVAQPGWNQQALPQGYPTLLLVANDFTTGSHDRLYGVFVDTDGQASLWSSATGFTDWRCESPAGQNDFPQDMKFSPGVLFDGEIWLIGGSSVEDKTSNAIWRYQKDVNSPAPSRRSWKRWEPEVVFQPRMGHCCVVFKDAIYVMGGYLSPRTRNDVWRLQKGTSSWVEVKPKGSIWSRRCLFAATPTALLQKENKELWIYGGVEDPADDPKQGELWSTIDGAEWKRRAEYELPASLGNPLAIALLYIPPDAEGALAKFADGILLAGSFQVLSPAQDLPTVAVNTAHMFRLNPHYRIWEDNPVSWGWDQFPGVYVLRCISFNQFWFFWAFNRAVTQLGPKDSIARRPKLAVFIPT
jgi:hypothetical protein